MIYKHTQKSPIWLFVAGPLLAITAIAAAGFEADIKATLITALGALLIIAIIAHFSTLTITVDERTARAGFGRGWPRKVVEFESAVGVAAVRNRWLYGFGIRWIPKGSLWNVWGLDAVEFALASGRVVRFGTDDVDGLLAALSGRVGSH